jgi:hypothetical protein
LYNMPDLSHDEREKKRREEKRREVKWSEAKLACVKIQKIALPPSLLFFPHQVAKFWYKKRSVELRQYLTCASFIPVSIPGWTSTYTGTFTFLSETSLVAISWV